MAFVSSDKDVEALTLTFIAEFSASAERVWQVWADPRQLERWWGPPTWPATFDRHEFVAGGQARYYMTGPEGQKSHGWWTITAIEAPHRLEFDDGFASDDGEPLSSPEATHCVVTIEEMGSVTRMTTVTTFASLAQLEQVLAIGAAEATRLAWNQIDGVLMENLKGQGK